MNCKQKSSKAAFWSILDALGKQGLQLIISIVLARLLAPEEFGVLAMLGVFTGVAMVITDGGFSAALIQKKEITAKDTSSVFYFNILISLLMATLLSGSATFIADFFSIPILRPLTYLMSFNLILVALGSVHTALLTKELDFKTQTRISITATIVSGIVCIILAFNGFGVWSLALRTVLFTFLSTALLWALKSWRPMPVFSLKSLQTLFSYGSYLLMAGVLNSFYDRLNVFLIGKVYSAADVGFYSRADTTQQLPTNVISLVLNRVAFPIFSQVNQDKALLRRGVRKSIIMLMMINIPMMCGLAVLAEPVIIALFGEKWYPSIRFLQILCLAGLFWPLHVIHLSVLRAQGHSKIFFWLDILKKTIGISVVLFAATISLDAIAWSQVIIGFISYFINAYYTNVFLEYSILQQLSDILPYVFITSLMLGIIFSVSNFIPEAPFIKLFTLIPVGALSYSFLSYLFKPSGYFMVMDFVSTNKKSGN